MIIDNVFTLNEIKKLQQCCDALPVKSITINSDPRYINLPGPGLYVKNKEISYQHNLSPFRKIIKPKIDAILGTDHVVDTSGYREYTVSHALHVDSYQWQKQMDSYHFSDGTKQLNQIIIIPLMDGNNLKTTVFDIYTDEQCDLSVPLPTEWLTSQNNLNPDEYQHFPEHHLKDLNKLPLIGEFEWKLGSVIVFDRCLLHCSINFSDTDRPKKMIILFLA
jgi:hypothetical protein